MTAEAIARMKEMLYPTKPRIYIGLGSPPEPTVSADDLRALLDAHAALDVAHREVTDLTGDLTPEVLTRLSDVQGYVRCGDRAALGVDYARGVADERARVVADLRKVAAQMARLPNEKAWTASAVLEQRADRYERGEHESEGA